MNVAELMELCSMVLLIMLYNDGRPLPRDVSEYYIYYIFCLCVIKNGSHFKPFQKPSSIVFKTW